MQNIKNFRLVNPTEAQLLAFANPVGERPLFLRSEDGQDWYECQSLFADNTIKIMYDSNGVIQSVVDRPVPERGNIYAVSMFFPDGLSVAEVEILPAGFELSSDTWVYDGTTVYQDQKILADKINSINTRELYRRLALVSSYVWMLQSCAAEGVSKISDEDTITVLQKYTVLLRSTDLTQYPAAFPSIPDVLHAT